MKAGQGDAMEGIPWNVECRFDDRNLSIDNFYVLYLLKALNI